MLVPPKGLEWDGVLSRVIREEAWEIGGPLSCLFNCCIQGVSTLNAIFKGGSHGVLQL